MPSMQLFSVGIEIGVNRALSWAHNRDELLEPLINKSCIIHTQELENALIFDFSAQSICVRVDQDNQYGINPDDNNKSALTEQECWVSVSLFALDKLKQGNQLSKLIKTGQLDFAGDLSILQSVSSLFDKIDLNFEEILSQYIGDVAAFQVNSGAYKLAEHAKKQLRLFSQTVADAALDEKPIAVRKIMLVNFCDEVEVLSKQIESLDKRISRLEKQNAGFINAKERKE